MAFLFDTNAVSEALRKRPNRAYLDWLQALPRQEQFSSIIVVAELYAGAHASAATQKWLDRIEADILPGLTILDFTMDCARAFGRLRAGLARSGRPIGDVDTQIAATALVHDLTLVTANARHFFHVPALKVKVFTRGEIES